MNENDLNFARDHMPIEICYALGDRDEWLRYMIRGDGDDTRPEDLTPVLQRVVVQGVREADRVCAALARLKYDRNKPWGGAVHQRWHGKLVDLNYKV